MKENVTVNVYLLAVLAGSLFILVEKTFVLNKFLSFQIEDFKTSRNVEIKI